MARPRGGSDMNIRGGVLATLFVFAASAAQAVDVPVTYIVDEAALKTAATGTVLTFELHNDNLCAGVVHTQNITIDNTLVSRLKRFKPQGGTKPPRTAELRATLTNVSAPGHFYLEVTGTGVMPLGDACQAQAAIGDIPETCSDGIQNQDETDVDCGGDICAVCANGADCNDDGDCSSESCVGGQCAASCTDSIQNQGESDVDCGGTCPQCQEGQGCFADPDCVQLPDVQSCVSGQCTNHCFDSITNVDESDIDCGGVICSARCGPGYTCNMNEDCASGICMGGNTCQ
jgi:hypothetical protein